MQEKSTRSRFQFLLLAIPTVFDLIATVLMNIGLLSVTASVYQMMRGAEMLFAALFAVCCVVGSHDSCLLPSSQYLQRVLIAAADLSERLLPYRLVLRWQACS